MLTIFANTPVTRRQSFCRVLDEDNQQLFVHRHLSQCLNWCVDAGHMRVNIVEQQGKHQDLLVDIDTLPWEETGE